MPALYAHDRFGAEVSGRLTGERKEIISKYYTQYQIGLQGPDIFFFYGAHTNNKVVRFGEHLHEVSAYPFFRHAVKVVQEKGRDSREYAYLLGFLCHFTLDSECHPYVEAMIGETGVQHLEIEEEFEKLLLRLDGEDAVSFALAGLVPTDEETARAIQPFYPVRLQETGAVGKLREKVRDRFDLAPDEKNAGRQYLTVATIRRSLKDLRWIKKFFTAPQAWKQNAINSVMKAVGVYEEMNGLMLQRVDNPKCAESNAGLKLRYDGAVEVALELMEYLDDSIQNGVRLPKRFDRTFS